MQIKICGLTRPAEAAAIASLGTDALGLVFHPPSPRFVDMDDALAIISQIPKNLPVVGVFVDNTLEEILRVVTRCGLRFVQLHGSEPPSMVEALRGEGLRVIKALFHHRFPRFGDAASYSPDAFLLEGGQGPLPGGNARSWNWSAASRLSNRPIILAGGLTERNVEDAAGLVRPDAVDVSSGVEFAPGRKDPSKVEAFLRKVRSIPHQGRRIFP